MQGKHETSHKKLLEVAKLPRWAVLQVESPLAQLKGERGGPGRKAGPVGGKFPACKGHQQTLAWEAAFWALPSSGKSQVAILQMQRGSFLSGLVGTCLGQELLFVLHTDVANPGKQSRPGDTCLVGTRAPVGTHS